MALPPLPPPRPKERSHAVSSDDLLEEHQPVAGPGRTYPVTLLEKGKECYSDFGSGGGSDDDADGDACTDSGTGGHLPSLLLNDSSDVEDDHVSAIPCREKRESSHPIDGDDWLDQDDQDDQHHHQQQQPKAASQASWFRRRRSVSPPCAWTDLGGTNSSKHDSNSNSNMHKSLNQSERQNSHFPRSPSSKPLSCSDRGVRRSFFSPLALENRKSPPRIAGAMTEVGNLRPRSETETTSLMDELPTF